MIDTSAIKKNWRDSLVKGTFPYFVLSSLDDRPATMQEVRLIIDVASSGAIRVDDNSLYRTLRRLYDQDLVDFTVVSNPRGPDRKLYQLTSTGRQLLIEFGREYITPLINVGNVKRNLRVKGDM